VRGRGSGAEAEVPTGGVFEIRDGRVVRWQDFGSREAALAALGPTDVVRLVHGAFNQRDLDEFLAYWDPACSYHSSAHREVEGAAGVFRGHDGIRRWWEDLDEHFEDLATVLRDVQDLGDGRVLVEYEVGGRGRGSGISVPRVIAQLATVRDGKLVTARDYQTRADALSSEI
jgi:ketosteroid isomerase-like protein